MRQPSYEGPVTQEHILSGMRLPALKDYYRMVAPLRELAAIRSITFDVVPALLVRIRASASTPAH